MAINEVSLEDLRVTYLRNANPDPGGRPQFPRLKDMQQHILFMGTTGSGKTTAMDLHMTSVLPAVPTTGFGVRHAQSKFAMNFRAIVYDPKTTTLPTLGGCGMSLEKEIILTNPFDSRAVAWDVSKDIDNTLKAKTFATILVADHEYESPFWQKASRRIVHSVINGLNQRNAEGGRVRWTFRQLIEILSHEDYIRQVLQRTTNGRRCLKRYLEAESVDMKSALWASLDSNLEQHRIAAAAWHQSETSFSFTEWIRGGGVIVLGDSYEHEDQAAHVNNLLLRQAFSKLLSVKGRAPHTQTFVYLDEIRRAGKFPNFRTLLAEGREKGIRVVLAAQGLSTFTASFDKNEVAEVLNSCVETCVMKLHDNDDAEWAERLFSTSLQTKTSIGTTDGKSERTRTRTQQEQPRLLAREFKALVSAKNSPGGRDLNAFLVVPETSGYCRAAMPTNWVNEQLKQRPNAVDIDPLDERDGESFEPVELEPDELVYLGLVSTDNDAETHPSTAFEHQSESVTDGVSRFRLPPPPKRI